MDTGEGIDVHCGSTRCTRVLRQDEHLTTVQIHGVGILQACAPCVALATGGMHRPTFYVPGRSRVPRRETSDGNIDVCGICRLALRHDESPRPIRLHPDDLVGLPPTPWLPDVIEPGCYAACRACVDFFRPRVHRRLVAMGLLPACKPHQVEETSTLNRVVGNMLL